MGYLIGGAGPEVDHDESVSNSYSHLSNDELYNQLSAIKLSDGSVLFKIQQRGDSLHVGCACYRKVSEDLQIISSNGARHRFDSYFSQIHGQRSGKHHPDGLLWIANSSEPLSSELPLTGVFQHIKKCLQANPASLQS